MKRVVHIAILAALSLFLVVPLVLAQPTQVMQSIKEVERKTQEIRGLTEKAPIDVRFMSQDELEQKLIEDLNEDYAPEDWERDGNLLKLLGFMEEEQDYYDILLGLYTEQIAGFYDPEDKYLVLISGEEVISAYEQLTLSHEITHALQDQYYHLDEPPYDDPDSTDYDADFAATCLIEGDATLTMYKYQETFTMEDYAEMLEGTGDFVSEKFDAAPQYIQDSLLFPYQQGEVFAKKLYSRDGFNSIDDAYADPPASTEQVMHPEKYFSREMPDLVECPDIASSLGEGWELEDTNVLGEFDIDELLMTELSEMEAERGSDGWGGSQYRFYSNAASDENIMVIDLAWDSPEEAEEFAALFGAYAFSRLDPDAENFTTRNYWAVWDGGKQGGIALSLDGDRTYVAIVSDPNDLDSVTNALGEGGAGLAELLRDRPRTEGSTKKDATGADGTNWTALGIIIGFLALVLVLFMIVLFISRRERVAQELYPPYMPQQPEWPQRPPQVPGPYQPPMPPQPPQPPAGNV